MDFRLNLHYFLNAPHRVLENVESGVFLRQLWFCTHTFSAGDSNLRQFFSADASQTP